MTPVKNGVGYGAQTATKMQHFRTIIDWHISVTQAVISKNNYFGQDYHYIDATAGPGICPSLEIDGSPLVFLDVANLRELSYLCYFIEQRKCNCDSLKAQSAIKRNKDRVNILHGDYQTIVPRLGRDTQRLGLVFIDPSGQIPHFDALQRFARRRPRTELLFYLSATTLKRTHHLTDKRLSDYIDSLDKHYWLVREPASNDSHQFTFLLGSNSPIFDRDYKKIGLHRLGSPTAQEFFPRLNFTRYNVKKNRKETQMMKPISFKHVSTGEAPPPEILHRASTKWNEWRAAIVNMPFDEWRCFEFETGHQSRLAMGAAKNMQYSPKWQTNGKFAITHRRYPTVEDKPSKVWIIKHEPDKEIA